MNINPTDEPAALPLHKEAIHGLPLPAALAFYDQITKLGDDETMRWMCRNDRYFLLVAVIGRGDMVNEWCYNRCREVEASSEGWLDLWSRGHYKSTIITFAGTIQEILKDPNITICILSYNGATARAFVQQVMQALEMPALINLFPDILWPKPPTERWSVKSGLWVKRTTTVKEATLSGGGLVDAQPTGFHFALRVYDDVVTPESVSTAEQIQKTTAAWELSDNLGIGDGSRVWMVGTRYHPFDTYDVIMKRGSVKERRRICVDENGNPLLLSRETLEKKRIDMGVRTFAAQMLQQPVGEGVRMFKADGIQFYDRQPDRSKLNVYILIDSANAKRKNNDYTTMWVIGLGQDENYYILDVVRDRMNLVERTNALLALHRKWRPIFVYWEQVGAMSDTAHVRDIQDRDNYRFVIIDIPQKVAKHDRIAWLIPLFGSGRIWFPRRLLYTGVTNETRDLVRDFIDFEFDCYPHVSHDDMLDDLANIKHPACADMQFPKIETPDRASGQNAKTCSTWNPHED
jgi:predicted phage terminase large subunit-like protein